MEFKNQLQKILSIEIMKKKSDKLISEEVYSNWTKLVFGSSTAKNKIFIQEALKQYDEAKQTNTKISRFSLQKDAKPLENYKKYKEQTKNEEENFLSTMEPDQRKPQKGYRAIDTIRTKISKQSRNDFKMTVHEAKKYLEKDLLDVKNYKSAFRFSSVLEIEWEKYELVSDGKEITDRRLHMKTYMIVIESYQILTLNDINNALDIYEDRADVRFENEKMKSSGWSFSVCSYHNTSIYENKKLRGSSYVPTPPALQGIRNKWGVNIENKDDNECFKWCMKYHQSDKGKNSTRISALKKVDDKFNYDDITYPVGIEEINIFEANNEGIKINVFQYDNEKDEINVLRRAGKSPTYIHLLVINDNDNEHYCYINNLSALFKTNTSRNSKVFCEKCLKPFTQKQFDAHQCDITESNDFQTVINYPGEDECMKMTVEKYKKQMKAPFIAYSDFEAFVKPTNDTSKIQEHVVNSYCIQLVCSFDPKYSKLYFYRGENAVQHYIETLLKIKDECDKVINYRRKLYKNPKLTAEEEAEWKTKTDCYICGCEFTKENHKIREHCHLSGKYNGAACNTCNLNFKNVKISKEGKEYHASVDLIVAFHNLRGYDGHFILQEATKYTDNIRAINQSFEKYMTFQFMGLRFIDSFLFLSESLSKLADSLKTSIVTDKKIKELILNDNFVYLKGHFKENAELMGRKGVYPYEYAKDASCFELGMPDKKEFYSKLNNSHIKDEEYIYALEVYEKMKCKNFGDYHDLYLICDVLLLADVFENFRKSSIEKYKFDPANYLTTPSLAWDVMLDMTKCELGLISNEEARLFFENNKRGGIVQAGSKRLVRANNKYMKNYDPSKPSIFIWYVDANNLYAVAMIAYLPYKLLGFVTISLEEILNHPKDDEHGYFVECDIHLPPELYEKFKEYPLCPVTRNVKTSELSDYQKSVLELNKSKHSNNSKKLILDLYDKEKYMCHYRYLQTVVRLGYVVKKVHRVMKFEQRKWLKPYIDKNTEYRSKPGISGFEKDFYKLMNNSVSGKTYENVLGRTSIELVRDEDKAIKKMSKENFKSGTMLHDMFFIESHANKVEFNRPNYIGNAILDLSKIVMIDFHYDYMKPKYGDKCELIYTDTDSFVYEVKTDDLYRDNYEDRQNHFDLSEVIIKEFNDPTNGKKIGMMKDETKMCPIVEFCAMGPKSYSFLTDDDEVKKKGKGVSKAVLKTLIEHDDYKNTLETGIRLERKNTCLRSFKHRVFTYECNKICLSAFDDKIYRESFNYGYPYGYVKQ